MPQASSELPFVIGVLADLSGRTAREPLDRRRFITIDRDNFNDVMERLAPRVTFQVPAAAAGSRALDVDLTFASLEDFAPDAIAASVPPLAQLLAKRRRLLHAPTADTSDADLQQALRRALGASTPPAARHDAAESSSLGFLDQVLEHTGDADTEPPPAPARPQAGASPIEQIDQLLSQQVNQILHHPELRALEATWRGLWHLVFHAETGPTLSIRALDLPRSELTMALADPSLPDDEQPALVKLVYSEAFERPDGVPFGLLAADYEFDHQSSDVLTLISLVSAAARVPFIAAAAPGLFGASRWSDLELTTSAPSRPAAPSWEKLRSSDEAQFLFLAAPRLLARYPYGQKYTAVESLAFEEDAPTSDMGAHLWMNPAYALAALVARAFAESGRPGAIRQSQHAATITGLPVLPLGADARQAHCLEALIGRRADEALREAGITPLLLSAAADGRAFVSAAPSLRRRDGASRELSDLLDACRQAHQRR